MTLEPCVLYVVSVSRHVIILLCSEYEYNVCMQYKEINKQTAKWDSIRVLGGQRILGSIPTYATSTKVITKQSL